MREPRQIVLQLVHRTLADKALKDVLRSIALSDIARQAPILSQTKFTTLADKRRFFLSADQLRRFIAKKLQRIVMQSVTDTKYWVRRQEIRD